MSGFLAKECRDALSWGKAGQAGPVSSEHDADTCNRRFHVFREWSGLSQTATALLSGVPCFNRTDLFGSS